MIYKIFALNFGMLFTFVALSFSQNSSINEGVVISDTAMPDTRITMRIQTPEDSSAVEFKLKIDDPQQLDLDLFVYDSDPRANGYVPPVCVSDSIGADEICAVKRPASGDLWVTVAAANGEGKSSFILTRNLVDSSHAELALADPISPNGREFPLNAEKMTFQFKLEAGEIAIVVLEGEERRISVEDEDGQIFPSRRTGIGRQQVAIGTKFSTPNQGKTIDWLLRSLEESKRYIIKVGPSYNPYNQTNSVLSVLRPARTTDYVIAFSVDNLDNEPKTIDGPSRNLTRPGTQLPIFFKFLPNRSPLMLAEAIPNENYDIAICDEYGFVVDISSDKVLWNPSRTESSQTRRGSGNMYFVVFPSPLASASNLETLPKMTLLIKPLQEN